MNEISKKNSIYKLEVEIKVKEAVEVYKNRECKNLSTYTIKEIVGFET